MTRPRILVLCFFPAFEPPASGGELRLLNLYRALSATVDVTLLTSTDFGARQEQILHTPSFREIRFPKDQHWRRAYETLERTGLEGDLSGLAMALAVGDPACAFTRTARALAPNADAILHEFPYSEPIFADGAFAAKEIYNSHNFETSLLGAIVTGPGFETALLKLMRLEGNLAARAARVLATSEADADKFRLFHGVEPHRLALCPNGFDPAELQGVAAFRAKAPPRPAAHRPRLLFFGSAHSPNVEGARALIAMAGELADCDIVLAGAVSRALGNEPLPPNVVAVGPFDRAGKLRLLAEADLFVNPVVLGSGTSLKALEALGAGVPMVSTPEGARGLELAPGQGAAIVARAAFPATVRRLLASPDAARNLGKAGRRHAETRFTWQRIAQDLAAVIADPAPAAAEAAAPLILAFNDYPALDAAWGGKARIRNLLGQLSADVVLVSFGPTCDVVRLGPNLLHVLVPKAAHHLAFEQAANQGQPLTVDDCVASLFAGSNRILRTVACALARRAGALVFEHCYMAPILDAVESVRPGIPVVYSAHNVEARHRVAMLAGHSAGAAFGALVAEVEQLLVGRAALVVCCTAADAAHFAEAGAATLVVANGCAVPARDGTGPRARGRDGLHHVGFMGSGHAPNVEAAEFILRELAPAFPEVCFDIVGGVGDAVGRPAPGNVRIHGVVDETRKSELLDQWTVALNPVESGGGSSLKLPDFLAHGLPTISTAIGARGFAIERRGAGLVVERRGFRASLAQLLGEPAVCARMSVAASAYAEEDLSWIALARPYDARLRSITSTAPRRTDGRSLLVVTYRYTEPPLGGAEEYLVEVLKHLRPRYDRIDLATVDLSRISDRHHFGTRVSGVNTGHATRVAELFDQALFFPPRELPEADLLEGCRRLERAWTRTEFDLYLPFAHFLAQGDRLRPLAGFYGPEKHGGATRRWTSPNFSLLLPRSACSLRIVGYAAQPKTLLLTLLHLTAEQVPQTIATLRQNIPTWFTLNFTLPAAPEAETILIACEVDEHVAVGDHRPLGVLIESVTALVSEREIAPDSSSIGLLGERAADLEDDVELQIRTEQFEAWLGQLNKLGQQYDAGMEGDFAAARGPHSPELQHWLSAHASAYHTVLVQGIPFDVIPRCVETLQRDPNRPRIVTLPHFHGDDRFYYWMRYRNALATADASLIFSPSIANRLSLPGRAALVAGGGVSVVESSDLRAAAVFNATHQSHRPFFLVLGRKTASKGYRRVINAHQRLRVQGEGADLVIIGPDYDGHAVEGEGIHYLGYQPRDVISGALAGCIGLVTMSTSESFGIVICEAWLFGKAVIANRASYAFRELIDDGKTGILVNNDDELLHAMHQLENDSDLASKLGANGRDRLIHRFTWAQVADQIDRIL